MRKNFIFLLIVIVVFLSACGKSFDDVPVPAANFPFEPETENIYTETEPETSEIFTEEIIEAIIEETAAIIENITETTESVAETKLILKNPELMRKSMLEIFNSDFIPSEYLINNINELIKNDTFRTGFYLKSLDGSIEMGYNITQEYSYDSTIKTAVALYLYKEVLEGRVNLDEYIKNETIGGLIERMLITSDSDAYLILRNYFGKEKVNALTKSLGCTTFFIINDWGIETPKDAGILFEGVYKFCADENSGEIGELFLNQLIASHWNYIGEVFTQYTVAHKYGQTGNVFAQNCLILKDEGSSYIFTYYTSGGYNPNNSIQVFATLDEIMKEYDDSLEREE